MHFDTIVVIMRDVFLVNVSLVVKDKVKMESTVEFDGLKNYASFNELTIFLLSKLFML